MDSSQEGKGNKQQKKKKSRPGPEPPSSDDEGLQLQDKSRAIERVFSTKDLESGVVENLSEETLRLKENQAAIEEAFKSIDLDGCGHLDRKQLRTFLAKTAKQIRLDSDEQLIDFAIDALLEEVNDKQEVKGSFITKSEFFGLFLRHPEMMRVFDGGKDSDKGKDKDKVKFKEASVGGTETSTNLSGSRSDNIGISQRPPDEVEIIEEDGSEEEVEEDEENLQIWQPSRTRWKNWKVAILWLAFYIFINLFGFTTKALKYWSHTEACEVFGPGIIVARACAQCLNINAYLILIPMCRPVLTIYRSVGPFRKYFPFDALREMHMLIGTAILCFAIAHVIAHLTDFAKFAEADEADILALLGDKLGETIPPKKIDRWILLLTSRAGSTGIIMVLCMFVAYPCTLVLRKRYNLFWYTHHLLLVMLVALCFHGTGNLLEPFQSVYWIGGPLLLYLLPRIHRETKCVHLEVLDVQMKPGGLVGLRLAKPPRWNNYLKAGMYAHLNLPQVSWLEWHPFTLTSAPHEDWVEFHFRRVGDWTTKVHDLLRAHIPPPPPEDTLTKRKSSYVPPTTKPGGYVPPGAPSPAPPPEPIKETPEQKEYAALKSMMRKKLVVKVEGPLGASSQGFKDYPVVVLVGAGIGVTPMISVLKHLLHRPKRMRKCYFYWTVRDRAAFEWFCSLMDEVYETQVQAGLGKSSTLQIRHFLTGMSEPSRNLGSVLFQHARRETFEKTNFDMLLGRRTHHQVEVGRPNWESELTSVRTDTKAIGERKVGVFLCGPAKLADALTEVCFQLSAEDPDVHFTFAKETF